MTELFVIVAILFSLGLSLAIAYWLYKFLGRWAGLSGGIGTVIRWGTCGLFVLFFEPILFGTILHTVLD